MRYDPAEGLRYELVRSRNRKKTLTLQIKPDGTVVLLVPYRISRSEADGFFRQKEDWVRRKLAERSARPGPGERRFAPGEEFLYHGEPYPLKLGATGSGSPLSLSCGVFLLRPDRLDQARETLIKWYRDQARRELPERVALYGRRADLVPTGITITSALSRYGSCSARDRLSFSWRIIMAPYPVMDYVILHELAHIREKNHSGKFWAFLETLLPDYRERRAWFRENGHLLRI